MFPWEKIKLKFNPSLCIVAIFHKSNLKSYENLIALLDTEVIQIITLNGLVHFWKIGLFLKHITYC